jgi:hypothetical protein
MKQLLLNFMFFVGAAFIFFQCAKLFPSEISKSRQPVAKTKSIAKKHTHRLNVSQYFTGKYIFRPNSKTGVIISYIGNGMFPLNILQNINTNPFVVSRNWGFNYIDMYGRPLYSNSSFNDNQTLTAESGDDDDDYPYTVK